MKNIHPTRSALAALTLSAALLTSLATPLRAADVAKAASEVTAAAPRAFGGQVAGAIHLTATVESINYLTREVILKSSDTGERKAITAGPEVQRLTEIHQGDTIEMVYAESVIVLVGDHAGAPVREDSVTAARAGADQKPGALVTTTTTVLATVEAIDHTARTATLKGPKRTVTINVPADAVNFDQVKVGDSVYVEFTQAVAAAVTKSAPVPAK
jgi:hypothetical protein